MRVAVFGARGRTGRHVVAELQRRGHEVIAVTRTGEAVGGATGLRADPVSGEGVADATDAADAVVCAMTSGRGNPACSRLAEALSGRVGLRYVTVGGAAVNRPGDRKGLVDRLFAGLMHVVARPVLEDRERELALLEGSALRWTMLRPPRLLDREARGTVRLSDERPPGLSLERADLARAVADALEDDALVGRAPFVSN
ncbi:NAD(P)-dependent oxidoreductase [Rubellimicrobium sp. CFH 75288]|uniref:NAD(P)-dependent oxidoreductase n=1 Tax=Rubellimicrobium sp. CFH 75288 TaxID=2697034 RepID=UPI001413004A|nr:NAD(P)H-binding protein [Rubellimicrobium sp. CFH 75288]NAZ35999.1 NAD(P)H-binding protein [Rubellimicrobium sp. CFH 75288]